MDLACAFAVVLVDVFSSIASIVLTSDCVCRIYFENRSDWNERPENCRDKQQNPTRSIANGSNFKGTELGIASEQMKVSKVPRTSPITPKRNACEIVFLTRNDEGMPCALKTAKLASFWMVMIYWKTPMMMSEITSKKPIIKPKVAFCAS